MPGREQQKRKTEYVEAVARGEGFMPWQSRESVSRAEKTFRERIERRKDDMLGARVRVKHPLLLDDAGLERVRRNIRSAAWAKTWYTGHKRIADHVLRQSRNYVTEMVSELTPWYDYGMTCPKCVHVKSQEGRGEALVRWDYRNPDVMQCRYCGQVYPDAGFRETADLVCPRTGQTLTFYLNDAERRHPDDRSGRYAYHWVSDRNPMHMSFSGVIRQRKAYFMIDAVRSLALCYRIEGDSRYAARAVEILVRLSHCYRRWLYHDYWNTVADCDPMYAAWHDTRLRLEWKKHLCTDAFSRDTVNRAQMRQNYWGAGRLHPSCDSSTMLVGVCMAYDLVHGAKTEEGAPLWTPETRAQVERDLFMEWIMGAEPFLGGAGKATNVNNKAGRVYWPMAAVARCLGITEWADVALRGFEAQQDKSLALDGFSHESPSYTFSTASYLGGLIGIAEALHGFRWPKAFASRKGRVDLFRSKERFRLLMRAAVDHLCSDGCLLPAADTPVGSVLAPSLVEVGLKRCPEFYTGALAAVKTGATPSEYAVLHLDAADLEKDRKQENRLSLPEIYFPSWMTAILRHGEGESGAALALTFSPKGGHRHLDNLAIYYMDRGDGILGDLGYVGDTPMNSWIRSTSSHNLVVVDGQEQLFRIGKQRRPSFGMMVTSPKVSVVEAASRAYTQCKDFRRLVALVKGPDGQTFAVDIFRVKGGSEHDYRIFSELAASDARNGAIEFGGLTMPAEPPLPEVGASVRKEDIFGLRDSRTAAKPAGAWQAVWKERGRRYRFWMLSQVDRAQVSNGPGQESREQQGRRVRYLDAIRRGRDLSSTFVAVHEPSGPRGSMPVKQAVRLSVPAKAGPDAVALRIESRWGTYYIFSEFRREAEVDGIRFEGKFGIVCETSEGTRWLLTSGATTLKGDGYGLRDAPASWSGKAVNQTERTLFPDCARPSGWRRLPGEVTNYVRVKTGACWTGFPVRSTTRDRIAVDRFPLPAITRFELPAVQYREE